MIKPLKNYVLLKKITEENKSKSGLILSVKEEKRENIGQVVAFGPEVKNIKAKAKVIFENYKGTEVKENDEDFIILEDKNILGIIE